MFSRRSVFEVVLALLAIAFTSTELFAQGRSRGYRGATSCYRQQSSFTYAVGSCSPSRMSFFSAPSRSTSYGYAPPPIILDSRPPAPSNLGPLPNLGRGPSDYYSNMSENGGGQIDLTVPDNSEVWINGELLKQVGRKRQFVTPVHTNTVETYTVRIKWMENGKEKTSTQNVQVRAGSKASVMVLAAFKPED
jgi:uncharacterized protein (TIGR03000 family)